MTANLNWFPRFFSILARGRIALALAVVILAGFAVTAAAAGPPSYADYALVLERYVDEHGLVDYKGLKGHSGDLDRFVRSLAKVSSNDYDSWTDADKIAFWINAYNGLTLRVILDHYPIKPSFLKSFVYPENSIRQIAGVWDKITFPVMGREVTLDHIEHGILRAKFNEPRIHMALNCASMGCPPLRREPFVGARLDAQLDDMTRRFLKNPAKFRIDRPSKTVYLSPIFKWFGGDFAKRYGAQEKFPGFSDTERAVLDFVSKYIDPEDGSYLEKGKLSIEYLDYDWSLNVQPKDSSVRKESRLKTDRKDLHGTRAYDMLTSPDRILVSRTRLPVRNL